MQASAAVLALAAMALWPPATGRLLLVPLASDQGVVGAAVAGGALLLGAGPWPRSQVVIGDRAAILRAVAGSHILVLAAPPAGCRSLERAR